MARKGYSTVFDAEKTAAARGVDVQCSPKASRNIMLALKGMRLEDAKDFLQDVTEKRRAVPMRVRHRKIKHRRGSGLGPGAFPVKAAGRVLRLLENAENNAEYKDLETENLRVVHASAYRGETIAKYRPRAQGRATADFEQTTNMEIVLGENERMDEREEAREERRGAASSRSRSKAKTTRRSVTEAHKQEPEKTAQETGEQAAPASDAAPEEVPDEAPEEGKKEAGEAASASAKKDDEEEA